jgi:flagellar biosynthesis GTPase FlhF
MAKNVLMNKEVFNAELNFMLARLRSAIAYEGKDSCSIYLAGVHKETNEAIDAMGIKREVIRWCTKLYAPKKGTKAWNALFNGSKVLETAKAYKVEKEKAEAAAKKEKAAKEKEKAAKKAEKEKAAAKAEKEKAAKKAAKEKEKAAKEKAAAKAEKAKKDATTKVEAKPKAKVEKAAKKAEAKPKAEKKAKVEKKAETKVEEPKAE